MYYDQYFPFYAVYAHPVLLDGEQMQEREFSRMKARYPREAARIQDEVECACEILDYEGSRLYDEYPDPMMLREMKAAIRKKVEREEEKDSQESKLLDELIEVLLYQEIVRRRCRRNRSRYYFT